MIGAGTLLALPVAALAQDDDDGGWVDEALSGLVEDGTLTQAQVDAVEQALETARPERGPGFGHHGGPFGGRFGGGPGIEEAAEAIGIDVEALVDALRGGQTLAEVAEANDVEPQAMIDALVAAAQERIDAAVEAGRLDEAEAAERAANVTERITALVNEGFEFHRGEGPSPDGQDDQNAETPATPDSPDTTEAPTTTTG